MRWNLRNAISGAMLLASVTHLSIAEGIIFRKKSKQNNDDSKGTSHISSSSSSESLPPSSHNSKLLQDLNKSVKVLELHFRPIMEKKRQKTLALKESLDQAGPLFTDYLIAAELVEKSLGEIPADVITRTRELIGIAHYLSLSLKTPYSSRLKIFIDANVKSLSEDQNARAKELIDVQFP